MAQLLIRQLDDQVLAVLKARAQGSGVSLEQSLRELLTAAARASDQAHRCLDEMRRQIPAAGLNLDVTALIREARAPR